MTPDNDNRPAKNDSVDMNSSNSLVVVREVTVRAILLNRVDQVLLQKVAVPGKPDFYITPGGRLDDPNERLTAAVARELKEETGFSHFTIQSERPMFSGSHVMQKKGMPVAMTEHFFVVRLDEEMDEIVAHRQNLTEEEREAFIAQRWFTLNELAEGKEIIVPVNLHAFVTAILNDTVVPAVDFRDPPEFSA